MRLDLASHGSSRSVMTHSRLCLERKRNSHRTDRSRLGGRRACRLIELFGSGNRGDMLIPQSKGPGYRSPALGKRIVEQKSFLSVRRARASVTAERFDMTISSLSESYLLGARATNTSGLFGRQGSSTLLRNACSGMRVFLADSAFWISAQALVMSPC